MENLSLVLWRERELLDTLLYRLETEQLLLAEGRTDRLVRAAGEVDSVLVEIAGTEVLRAMAADEAAVLLGLPANPSLRALADASEEPWCSILHEHRAALAATTDRVEALVGATGDLIASAAAEEAGSRLAGVALSLVPAAAPVTVDPAWIGDLA